MDYLERAIDAELDELLPLAPAIAIDGPKGVGKTRTASRRSNTHIHLDSSEERRLIEADPSLTNLPAGTVLLDEWQELPEVWDRVRRHVDRGAPPGRFLLTGSATPKSARGTHSGAGRILSLRMRPMSLAERGSTLPTTSLAALIRGEATTISGTTDWKLNNYLEAIAASGFPGMMALPPRIRMPQLDSYIQRVIDRDLPDLGFTVRRPETLRRWLASYAAASSTTTSYTKIMTATTGGDGEQPAKTTTIGYRDHLTQLWLLDEVPGWEPLGNELGKLGRSPKHQLADPALAARLLGLTESSFLTPRGAHMTGPLFESLATLSVRASAQVEGARVGHLRTSSGNHEIDLIVEGTDGQVLGIEVKLTASAGDDDVRHLLWLRDQLGERVSNLVIITTGTHAYRRRDGVAVIPLALLGI
ncbi:MAG: ATP-binding protein [Gulosibacter sp.]|uniref:ATP-binding protein n=1 Tax=Gulosibacter sp. TaxID=2817531 RepID=UPI003F90967C